MSTDSTDFTLLQAALDLTSSLDLKAGLQNFVDQACALTSSPHATLSVLDTWGATTLQLEFHEDGPVPEVPESLMTAIPRECASPRQLAVGCTRPRSARFHSPVPGCLDPRTRAGLRTPVPVREGGWVFVRRCRCPQRARTRRWHRR